MSSINDVAKLAAVSTATVSRVLNKHPLVREHTRLKVERAIKLLNYRVAVSARRLRTSQTRMVLALVPDLENPFFIELARGIGDVARQNDYELLLCETLDDDARERAFVQMLTGHFYDGVICMDRYAVERMATVDVKNLPWVACSITAPQGLAPYVSIDHRQGAVDAMQHLLALGHTRIALIAKADVTARRQMYSQMLAGAGLPERDGYVQLVDSIEFGLGERAAVPLLALKERPTAIFATSDILAVGAMRACHKAGLRVPQDVAVIGFDDVPIASMSEPALTTVAQPQRELGQRAMHLLLQRLNGHVPPSETLAHRVVQRQSTGPAQR